MKKHKKGTGMSCEQSNMMKHQQQYNYAVSCQRYPLSLQCSFLLKGLFCSMNLKTDNCFQIGFFFYYIYFVCSFEYATMLCICSSKFEH